MEKTQEEIERINRQRAAAILMLETAQHVMKETGCSLGADTIGQCIQQLRDDGCDEY